MPSPTTEAEKMSLVLEAVPAAPGSIRAKDVIDALAPDVPEGTVKSYLQRHLADGRITQDRPRGPYSRPAARPPRRAISAEDGARYRAEQGETASTFVPGDLMRFRMPGGGPVATVRLVIVQDDPPLDVFGEVGSMFGG